MSFTEKLKKEMDRLNLNAQDVAKIAGTALNTVFRWMNGISTPHPIMQRAFFSELKQMRKEKKNGKLCKDK